MLIIHKSRQSEKQKEGMELTFQTSLFSDKNKKNWRTWSYSFYYRDFAALNPFGCLVASAPVLP